MAVIESNVQPSDNDLEPRDSWFRSWFPYFRWVPTSPKLLRDAEEKLLSYVSTKSDGLYVDCSFERDEFASVPPLKHCRIWTRKFNGKVQQEADSKSKQAQTTPLVMIHGMGAGLGFFSLNFDQLSKERIIYAIDLPGFGRSSRCWFNSDPSRAEAQYISALEKWRQKNNLDKMILLGHSFGGYLSAAYAIKYPDHVHHLILADPWGFPERPKDVERRYNFPIWARAIFQIARHFNPLALLRVSGPLGPSMIKRARPDLISKFDALFINEIDDPEKRFLKLSEIIPAYLFHLNAHSPSGESAFHSMMSGFAWAKRPMLPRLADLDKDLNVTVIYGQESWVTTIPEEDFNNIRNCEGKTEVLIVPGAGHHVYAQAEDFNTMVSQACQSADSRQ